MKYFALCNEWTFCLLGFYPNYIAFARFANILSPLHFIQLNFNFARSNINSTLYAPQIIISVATLSIANCSMHLTFFKLTTLFSIFGTRSKLAHIKCVRLLLRCCAEFVANGFPVSVIFIFFHFSVSRVMSAALSCCEYVNNYARLFNFCHFTFGQSQWENYLELKRSECECTTLRFEHSNAKILILKLTDENS